MLDAHVFCNRLTSYFLWGSALGLLLVMGVSLLDPQSKGAVDETFFTRSLIYCVVTWALGLLSEFMSKRDLPTIERFERWLAALKDFKLGEYELPEQELALRDYAKNKLDAIAGIIVDAEARIRHLRLVDDVPHLKAAIDVAEVNKRNFDLAIAACKHSFLSDGKAAQHFIRAESLRKVASTTSA